MEDHYNDNQHLQYSSSSLVGTKAAQAGTRVDDDEYISLRQMPNMNDDGKRLSLAPLVSHHDFAHLLMAPFRIRCYLRIIGVMMTSCRCPGNRFYYNAPPPDGNEGMPYYVSITLQFISWTDEKPFFGLLRFLYCFYVPLLVSLSHFSSGYSEFSSSRCLLQLEAIGYGGIHACLC